MQQYFWLDGKRNDELGITLQSPIVFSQPVPNVVSQHIPGKNGDLHYWDGSYENITGTAKCFALGNDVENTLMNITSMCLSNPGYHRLEVSSEPGFFRLARIRKGPDTDIRGNILAPFSIEFDCMPQKWDINGECAHTFHGDGNRAFQFRLVNPYSFPAKPLIRLSVADAESTIFPLSLTIVNTENGVEANALTITEFSDYIDIDFENQNVYSGEVNMNNVVEIVGEFPTILPGKNTITLAAAPGTTSNYATLEITPRWWTL